MRAEEQAFPSVWTRPKRARREQPALSREQIVAAALELLDTEGIDALSMRKLGTRLNAGATSMYSHVANKDELIELVVDEVYGEIEVPDPGAPAADWRTAAVACAHSMRATLLRHPWIASVLGESGVSYLGPNALRMMDALLAVFENAGFPLAAADRAVNTLVAYVTGVSTSEAAFLTTLARSGHSEQEWMERLWPAAEQAVQPYPRLRALYAAQRGTQWSGNREESFGEGLACVLDGIGARLGG
ncbi:MULTISPECIES: TetR/AcrR family transcriptional regulator C-terminal domain-containing protein [Streptomyces]|uniref:TetR/AcrR family transcriptional regulator C-terminal domain-containing protein n=1 Tax=Streptomyces TaxID=1883 RepID=UPI0004CDC183|nr:MULTISPECIES: TetR/AcrR family transcriptional regulator C-terminal domain-containing protein [Streptomyces]KOT61495.1 TetR family transcriptional regulator [Streptomyces rimosus subsp. rimosus]